MLDFGCAARARPVAEGVRVIDGAAVCVRVLDGVRAGVLEFDGV